MARDVPDLSDRKVLVMGAASEAGRAIAVAFAEAGATVALTTATTDANEAFTVQRLARSLAQGGQRGPSEAIDMSLGANVQVAIRQVAKELGAIDVLVTAPAFDLSKPAERLTDADWARVLGLNLSAVFYACRGVAREMIGRELPPERQGDRGRIIVVADYGSAAGQPVSAVNATARAGRRGLVAALAAEWQQHSITVNAIDVTPAAGAGAAALALELAAPSAAATTGQVSAVEAPG